MLGNSSKRRIRELEEKLKKVCKHDDVIYASRPFEYYNPQTGATEEETHYYKECPVCKWSHLMDFEQWDVDRLLLKVRVLEQAIHDNRKTLAWENRQLEAAHEKLRAFNDRH